MKTLCLASAATVMVAAVTLAAPARAGNIEYPAYVPYPFHRSHKTRRIVRIIPYDQPFHVRVFTTPQQPPYYNVPAYRVISPF